MFQWAGVGLTEDEWYLINKAVKVHISYSVIITRNLQYKQVAAKSDSGDSFSAAIMTFM
jgi:hypothetical protein